MEIRIRDTGEVIFESEFRQRNLNISFPNILTEELLNNLNADIVLEGPIPLYTKSQYVRRDGVIDIEGTWYTNYVVVDKDAETIANELSREAASARKHRNSLLAESDWTQLSDAPINKEAWSTYRQALRDVPSQEEFPSNIIWPEEPS